MVDPAIQEKSRRHKGGLGRQTAKLLCLPRAWTGPHPWSLSPTNFIVYCIDDSLSRQAINVIPPTTALSTSRRRGRGSRGIRGKLVILHCCYCPYSRQHHVATAPQRVLSRNTVASPGDSRPPTRSNRNHHQPPPSSTSAAIPTYHSHRLHPKWAPPHPAGHQSSGTIPAAELAPARKTTSLPPRPTMNLTRSIPKLQHNQPYYLNPPLPRTRE